MKLSIHAHFGLRPPRIKFEGVPLNVEKLYVNRFEFKRIKFELSTHTSGFALRTLSLEEFVLISRRLK